MENVTFHGSLREAIAESFPYIELIESTTNYLQVRLHPFLTNAKTFISEKQYVDKSWRDLFSLHYCYTQYNKNHTDKAIRIHIFSSEINSLFSVSPTDYIGYFTLRPIPAPNNVLSKVVFKPSPDYLGCDASEELYVMTCGTTANIGSNRFDILSFPAYSQDSMATICAHADMLMMTEYMHKKYSMGTPSVKNFLSKIPPIRGRAIPSSGLTINQIAVCLAESGYQMGLKFFQKGEIESLFKTVDAYIESCIPCIIAFDEHVILAVGHTCNASYDYNYNKASYIVVDDSGYHFKNSFGMNPYVIHRVLHHDLKNILSESLKKGGVFCFAVEPEKVFLSVEDVEEIINKRLKGTIAEKYERRYLITDSNIIKTFLYRDNEIDCFEYQVLPHYVWYIEFYDGIKGKIDNLTGALIIDATAHKGDHLHSVLSKDLLSVKKRFSLLQKLSS